MTSTIDPPFTRSRHCRYTRSLSGSTGLARFACLATLGLAASSSFSAAASAQALPTGGTVVAGAASIATGANSVQVTQGSQSAAINWQGFSVGKGNSVTFVQPNSSAVALNRVTGNDASVILGNLSANGKVFLINSNGILFGKTANVNVGGLVASTLNLSNADFMAGHYAFSGNGGTIRNEGSIKADGGYVALLGGSVSNHGVIQANLGTVVLAAGEAITLDVAGDSLLNVVIDKGAVNALVQNGGMLRANGGSVLLTAQAAGALLHTVVNVTGVIEARTIDSHSGVIKLLGDMQSGTVTVGGTLDATAPTGGNGGFIETSAASVNVAPAASITTAAATGKTGNWLIDPEDFTVGNGGNISGATLSAMLVTNSVTINTMTGPNATVPGTPPVTTLNTASPGNGDINVNDAVAWAAAPSTTTLTFNAGRDVNINAPVTATNGNVVVCCGRDANVNAAITTTNGSILLSAGRDVNLNSAGANTVNPATVGVLTVTDGNLTLCAGHDVLIAGAVTLTRGTTIPAQSLGLAPGLTIITGNDGTGPGTAGGTLRFAPHTAPMTVTAAAVAIDYNPVAYASPTDYSTNLIMTEGAAMVERMLVFPTVTKAYDGTTTAVLTGFASSPSSGLPTGVSLVAGPQATAVFDSAAPGQSVGMTYSGYSLGGADAGKYALAAPCCGRPTRSFGTISAPPAVTPPVVTPPVVTPPVTPPVVTPPVVVPPVVVPPVVTPPVVAPPVVAPPVVAPPVVAPPVVAPPVVAPPVVAPPVVAPPVVAPPVVAPPVVAPPVVAPPVVAPPVVAPPVVAPPVVAPPVVAPPVVAPPVVAPPVVAPPVVAPPVVAPPVVAPPVVAPPVVAPPVVAPPVVAPPVVAPPVVTPPVVAPPVATSPTDTPVVSPPAFTPPVVRTVTVASTSGLAMPDSGMVSEQAAYFVPAAAISANGNLVVLQGGVQMPATQLASLRPVAVADARTAVAPATLPAIAVPAPFYPHKPARN